MRKGIKWIIILSLIAGLGWFGYKWFNRAQEISVDAFGLIPPKAIYCMITNKPITTWKDITESGTWKHLQGNSYFAELTASANSLDSLIRDNSILFDLIGDQPLIVSAHMIGQKNYDFLFMVDLSGASGIAFLNEYVESFSAGSYKVSREKYRDQDLFTITNREDFSHLYVAIPGNFLVASYSKRIATDVLDTYLDKNSSAKQTFIKTSEDLNSDGLFQLYLDYAMLPSFMYCYASTRNEYANNISKALLTSNLSVSIDENMIRAEGYTYINDSTESMIKTLTMSGKSRTELVEIAPKRTAFLLDLGFSSATSYFEHFENNLKQDVTEYEEYRANLKRIEEYLKINLQDHFIDWIGTEIGILELQSSGAGKDNEVALIFKANNIEEARKDLAHIEKMIRKRTPIKFKSVDHRGYKISYLSVKGLFKILLGKFFARYDKPYYTILNNFVIFSDHPQTLESMIDDYLDEQTLINDDDFRAFRESFSYESAAFVYLNTPTLFQTMKKLSDPNTKVSMEKNKNYITCFRHVGFQLVPEDGRFRTLFAEQFIQPELNLITEDETVDPLNKATPVLPPIETGISQEEEEIDLMELPYIYVQNLNIDSYTGFYPDSTVQYEVDLKNGFKDGNYTEFYENGKTKLTGSFKQDKRDGTWRRYDESGKLLLRRVYKNGEVAKER